MAFSLRGIVAVAVPAVVSLFGFLWFLKRKKSPAIEQDKQNNHALEKTVNNSSISPTVDASDTTSNQQSSSVYTSDTDKVSDSRNLAELDFVVTKSAEAEPKFHSESLVHSNDYSSVEKEEVEKAAVCIISPTLESSVIEKVSVSAPESESSDCDQTTGSEEFRKELGETVSQEKFELTSSCSLETADAPDTSPYQQTSSVYTSDTDKASDNRNLGDPDFAVTKAAEAEPKLDSEFSIHSNNDSYEEKEDDLADDKAEVCIASPTLESSVIEKVSVSAPESESSDCDQTTGSEECRKELGETVPLEKFELTSSCSLETKPEALSEIDVITMVTDTIEQEQASIVSSHTVHQLESVSHESIMHQSESLSQPHQPTHETESLSDTVSQPHLQEAEGKSNSSSSEETLASVSNPVAHVDIEPKSDSELKALSEVSRENGSAHQSEIMVNHNAEHQSQTSLHNENQSETLCESQQTFESSQKSVKSLNGRSDNSSEDETKDCIAFNENSNGDSEKVSLNQENVIHQRDGSENDHQISASSGDWSQCFVEDEVQNLLMEDSPSGRGDQSAVDGTCDRAAVDSPTEKLMSSSQVSSGCDNNSEISNDSGKGTSVTENGAVCISTINGQVSDVIVYEFNFPTDLCGRLIGRMGKNITQLKKSTGAQVSVGQSYYSAEYQTVVVQGTQEEVDNALAQIRKKFPAKQFPSVDLSPIDTSSLLMDNPMSVLPDIMQLSLPEGVSIDVLVSSIVDAGHLFVQQPTHPSFPSLEQLNQYMMMCYSQDATVPQLPRPVDFGVLCAAPMLNGWYRAQVVAYYQDTDECEIKYADYGGYTRIPASMLRQIRSDFTTLPFQAVECYLSDVTFLPDEVGFSIEASAVLEEYVHGKALQAEVIGQAEDGVVCVQLYSVCGNTAVLVNSELVNRGVASWIEQQ